jgi:hypothetical protein
MSARQRASGAGSPVAGGRYLEDFAVGQTYGSGRLRVDEERIKSFAAEFDPQPFHLDETAAARRALKARQLDQSMRRQGPVHDPALYSQLEPFLTQGLAAERDRVGPLDGPIDGGTRQSHS